MSDCVPNVDGTACIHCGWWWTRKDMCYWPNHNCSNPPEEILSSKGPGDHLHNAILKWVGEGPNRDCVCEDHINQMNAWGPAGCREHLDEIVKWLFEEAQKKKWLKLLTRLPGNDYVIRWMVKGAIAEAEKTTVTQSSDS